MTKIATKVELVAATAREREALLALLASMTPEQLAQPGEYGWSAKDHVAHLVEWERLLLGWYDAGLRGESPALPAEGYTWATMDALNRQLFERHRDDSYQQLVAEWQDSSRRMALIIEWVQEADLFAPGRFAWTGRGTLAAYLAECGPKHYRWAAVEIKRGLRRRR
jgi:hypothetical protein